MEPNIKALKGMGFINHGSTLSNLQHHVLSIKHWGTVIKTPPFAATMKSNSLKGVVWERIVGVIQGGY